MTIPAPRTPGLPELLFHGALLALIPFWSWPWLRPSSLFWLGLNPGFMHHIHLVFHEAGHMLLIWAGPMLHALGGTIGQSLMPLALAVSLLMARRWFDAGACLWWLGQSLADCAPYIADACTLRLPLITGGTGMEVEGHDWEFILGQMGWLKHDQFIAGIFLWSGRLVMLMAYAAMVGLFVFQAVRYRHDESQSATDAF